MDFRVIDKYLERYAESEARALPAPPGQWRHVVCIPACAEADNLLETLGSLARARGADQAVVVTVVNGRESATSEVHASNARTLEQLERSFGVSSEPLSWGELGGMTVLVVDRARSGRWLPPRQGVGLARKIAGDIALALIRQGFVQSEWISKWNISGSRWHW